MAILYDSWGNPTTKPVPSPSCPYAPNMLAANVKTVGPAVSTNQPPFQLYTYLFIASPDGFASDWTWNTYVVSLPLNWNDENAWTGVLRIEQSQFLGKRVVADAILLSDGSLFSASGGFGPADVYSQVYPLTLPPYLPPYPLIRPPNAPYGPNSYWAMGAQVASYNSPNSIVPMLGFANFWNSNQTPGVILIANPSPGRPINDAIGTAYSTTLVSPSGAFRPSDVGLLVTAVPDYMSSSPKSNLVFPQGSMIANYISPNKVTLTLPPMKDFVGAWLSEYQAPSGVNRSASSNNVPLFTDLNFNWLQIEVVARLLKSNFFTSVVPLPSSPLLSSVAPPNAPSPTFVSLRLRITTSDGGDSGYFYPGNAYVTTVGGQGIISSVFDRDLNNGNKAYQFDFDPNPVEQVYSITPPAEQVYSITSNPYNADWTARWMAGSEAVAFGYYYYHNNTAGPWPSPWNPIIFAPPVWAWMSLSIPNFGVQVNPDGTYNCPSLYNEIGVGKYQSNDAYYDFLVGTTGDVVRLGTYPNYIFRAYYRYFWMVIKYQPTWPPVTEIVDYKLYEGWGVDVGSDTASSVAVNGNTIFINSFSWDQGFIGIASGGTLNAKYESVSPPFEGNYTLAEVQHREGDLLVGWDFFFFDWRGENELNVFAAYPTEVAQLYNIFPSQILNVLSQSILSYVDETVVFTAGKTLVIAPSGSNISINPNVVPPNTGIYQYAQLPYVPATAFLTATHSVSMGRYNLYIR
jgi:hypothetical protein